MKKEKLYKNKEWLLKEFSEGTNYSEVGRKCGVSNDTIKYWCRKLDINPELVIHRKNAVNIHYFDDINTPEKAYWLGFIMADGCICTSSKSCPNSRLDIILKDTDGQHLEKLKAALYYSGDIIYKTIYDKRGFETRHAELRVNSKDMCRALEKHSVTPRKTGKEEIPNTLPKILYTDFVRGFFDGDGSIAKGIKEHQYRFKLGSSSLKIIKQVQSWFADQGICMNYEVETQYSMPFYILEKSGVNDCLKIFHILYDNAAIYLDRKYNRVQEFFQSVPLCSNAQ